MPSSCTTRRAPIIGASAGGLGDFQTPRRLAARRAVGSVGVYGAFFNLVTPLVLVRWWSAPASVKESGKPFSCAGKVEQAMLPRAQSGTESFI